MNWVISRSNKMLYHTQLDDLLKPIFSDIQDLNWVISDLEYGGHDCPDFPVNHEEEYFILSPADFLKLVKCDAQIIWGAFLGVPSNFNIIVDENNLPVATGDVWLKDNFQYPDAVIEITCFDSSYTIIKFKDEALSVKFNAYFTEAVALENFT